MSNNLVIINESGGFWYGNTENKIPQKKNVSVRAAAKNEVKYIHEIFVKMADIIDDPYWKNIFRDIAKNKPRRGFLYYSNYFNENGVIGKFTYKSKTNKEFYCDVNDDPNISVINVKNFMMTYGKIMSDMDKELIENQIEDNNNSDNYYTSKWSDIRNNIHKYLLINRFIKKISEEYNFSEETSKSLESTIYTGLSAKFINNNSIILENGEIIDIKGIINSNGLFKIEPELLQIKINTKNTQEDENELDNKKKHKTCCDLFNKFIKNIDATS